jgi:PadR family transcriptional regulator PadR
LFNVTFLKWVKTVPDDILGPLEYQLLSTLLEQPRDAYGITIMERIEQRTGRKRTLAAIYAALDRLHRKGFVSSWWGEPSGERGGRRKRLYKVEASGVAAVRRTERNYLPLGDMAPVGAGG